MKVIWKKLWLNPSDNRSRNCTTFLNDTLSNLWIFFDNKEIRALNTDFNKKLLYFDDDKSYLKTFLSLKWYELVKLFRKESDFIQYVKENKIRINIRKGKVLLWNIYNLDKRLSCVWIVLATKKEKVNEKVDNILENN